MLSSKWIVFGHGKQASIIPTILSCTVKDPCTESSEVPDSVGAPL